MTSYETYPRRRPSALPMVLAGAAFVMAAWMLVEQTGWLTPKPAGEPRAVAPRGSLSEYEQGLIAVREKAAPSVAMVSTSDLYQDWLGRAELPIGSGSGFVWDKSGTVITNFHVVRDPQSPPQQPRLVDRVRVVVGGREFDARVVNASPQHDLAVLRLPGNVSDLVPIEIGTSHDLQIGQTAIAIGAPFGLGQTMTTGIVSALGRTIETNDGNKLYGMIQVDAAINPGNSGGPLLDSAGRLIGVNTAIYSPSGASAGIGFAVPVDMVNEIVPRLIAGRSSHTVLGVRTSAGGVRVPPETGYASGAIFTEVVPNYGAALAGLRISQLRDANGRLRIEQLGDVIVEIDGQPIRGFSDIAGAIGNHKPGDIVKVRVVRGLPDEPKIVDLPVTLSAEGEGVPSGM
jgi:S1-C subfamily serine protease